MVLHFGYSAIRVDVETAFLYGDLEEEIYMECPQVMTLCNKQWLHHFNKFIYGLVHATPQYIKKAVEILKSSGFVGGSIDPCLYVKKSAKGMVYIALYVDDNLMVSNITAINDTTEASKSKGLVLKIVEGLQDYLSCKIKFSKDKKHALLGLPHLIKNLKNKFGGLVKDI